MLLPKKQLIDRYKGVKFHLYSSYRISRKCSIEPVMA